LPYNFRDFHIFDSFKFYMEYLVESKHPATLEFTFQIERFPTKTWV
jgi:hypothetical protein